MTREDYIKTLLQQYRLVSLLSEKNGCKVLRLRNRQTQTDLVLRSFPESVAAYEKLLPFQMENLPQIYDCICLSDGQIVLEEYIDGITVAQVLEGGLYRYRGAKKVVQGICNALGFLHSQGIVHRDIKPENVMIGKHGQVVLIDLNVSRQVSAASHDTVVMGTVGYAPPEQLGIAQTDSRTDIYALGVLLNVMLTGVHPSQALAKGKAGRIVRRCTAVNPDDRFQSAEKLSEKL